MPFQTGSDRGFDGGHLWFGAWPILSLVMFLILIGVVIWAVLRITREGWGPSSAAAPDGPPPDVALDEVRLRYARGEMARDEFVRRFQDLGGPAPLPPTPATAETPDPSPPAPPPDPAPAA
jgi:uncharacterized membrane protein